MPPTENGAPPQSFLCSFLRGSARCGFGALFARANRLLSVQDVVAPTGLDTCGTWQGVPSRCSPPHTHTQGGGARARLAPRDSTSGRQEPRGIQSARPSATTSRPHLDHISTTSRPHLDRISTASRPHLDRISTASRPHLDHISTRLLGRERQLRGASRAAVHFGRASAPK